MISFRTRDDVTASLISILAILVLAGSLVWLLQPLPDAGKLVQGQPTSLAKINGETDATKRKVVADQIAIAPLLWTEKADQIGPKALSTVTALAQARHLRVMAFRPQKAQETSEATLLPFSISVQGTYPDTMLFVKDLETTNTKLAVSLVQMAAADASSDHVSGTIIVAAYMKAAPEPTAGQGTDNKRGSSAQKSK